MKNILEKNSVESLNKENSVILKHDRVRSLCTKFDSIDEQRFLNSCLVDNWQRDGFQRDEYYPISISHYSEAQGISLGKAYSELKDLVERFREKRLDIILPDGKLWVTTIIYSYKYKDEDLTLEVNFNEEIIPYISGKMIAGEFHSYDRRLDSVSSNKRYIMVELLQRNFWRVQKHDFWLISLENLRKELNLLPEEYTDWRDLQKRIVKPAIQDLFSVRGEKLKVEKKKIGIIFSKEGGKYGI